MQVTLHGGFLVASTLSLLTLAGCGSDTEPANSPAGGVPDFAPGDATSGSSNSSPATESGAEDAPRDDTGAEGSASGSEGPTGAGADAIDLDVPAQAGGATDMPGSSDMDGDSETDGPDEPPITSTPNERAPWGLEENPSAGCTVPELPADAELTADRKLPDPFTRMDGTRITDRGEWRCRREELRQQSLGFIYGDKPTPAEGAVSGSVSGGSISVQVDDGGSTSFSASVNMNGATAPAPAIITYGGIGMPIPDGVARITFTPIESPGANGPKRGPFYEVYGADHPAGYLTAQAWQVSRILDVLEQNPDVIDPSRVGVTGCSRNGKGAFVAGVLDNRIALTMPFESGMGGTVALRLIPVLDPTGEWPIAAAGDNVRWLSAVQLRRFTGFGNGDRTDLLPIDMHEMMGLIAPRGLYILDNPNSDISWADENSAWVTANAGRAIFEALGVGDHVSYESTSGGHCQWRSGYEATLLAMIDKFLLGNESAETGAFRTEAANPPNPEDHYDWDVPTLSGEL